MKVWKMPQQPLLAVIASLVMIICLTGGSPAAEIGKGAQAPEFALVDTTGKTISLSQMQGKVVVVNFFTIWCQPCRAEMPELNAIYNENKDKGLQMVGVCLNVDPNQLRFFAKQMNLDYPILVGTDKVNKDYGEIVGVPTTFVINKQGKIADKIVGARTKAEFLQVIKPLL
ncbi:MAG TPA: alkyl hydroperoxide reductase [Desulfobacterales bacterium]|nr:alkyl hydroperoxide reductase [Desulfobacterales bacterium]